MWHCGCPKPDNRLNPVDDGCNVEPVSRVSHTTRLNEDTYPIYDGTDENGILGTVAPGFFAQEGRCWRMVYENAAGHDLGFVLRRKPERGLNSVAAFALGNTGSCDSAIIALAGCRSCLRGVDCRTACY